jgi:hypothetical protein
MAPRARDRLREAMLCVVAALVVAMLPIWLQLAGRALPAASSIAAPAISDVVGAAFGGAARGRP